MLEAETIFDSTHVKIHIVASKESGKSERVKERETEREREGKKREREESREDESAGELHAGTANRRVCKCSTRGCDAVMEEKNCLFRRPAFSQAHLTRPVI